MKVEVDRYVLDEAINALRHARELVPDKYYQSTIKPAIENLRTALATVPLKKMELRKTEDRDPFDGDTIPQRFTDLIDRSTLFGSLDDEKD